MAAEALPDITVADAVVIGAASTRIDGAPAVLARARAAFADAGAITLPSALEPAFLRTVLTVCRRGPVVPEQIGQIGWRTVEERDTAGFALRFALERPAFVRWLETATGGETLRRLAGVVAEIGAGTGQELGWHNDLHEGALGRRLAVTIHLSDEPYDGGVFEMRDEASGRLLVRTGALPPGSIILFRIDQRLRHRVTPVTSGGPRRVFAGWFSV
ncbi:MAG: 2OG-Fe(II) oxygenase [Acidobacteriota bacterium]